MSVYSTPRWRGERARYIARNPRCTERIGQELCGKPARYVDHVRPWRSGATEAEQEALFWDESNWQPRCPACHSRKTAARDGGFGNARRSV